MHLFEPFILVLTGTVVLASLLPPSERWAEVVAVAAKVGIVLLFFLHGAKLSRAAVLGGMRNWRLHLAVLAMTFVAFPLLGLIFASTPGLDPTLAGGLLFLTLLPSTVQSSIAFTSIARGNVAAAVCSATFSNLAGIVLTPLLVALLLSGPVHGLGAGGTIAAIESIVYLLLLPFLAGHLSQRWTGAFVNRHKSVIAKVDRGAILLVVYSAFGAVVREGIWSRISLGDLALLLGLCTAMLALALLTSWYAARLLGFSRADAIVMLFCGSKKSLATGVPMAGLLFPAALVGTAILPLMLFHQIQLMVCAWIAKALSERPEADGLGSRPAADGALNSSAEKRSTPER